MMVGDMRWFSKFVSEVMNSKLHITLPPPIRSQESEKFVFDIAQCLLRATELSKTPQK